MLINLRASRDAANAAASESDTKFAADVYELMSSIGGIEEAYTMEKAGDLSGMEDIFNCVLEKHNKYKDTRSTLANKVKFTELCHSTMRAMADEITDEAVETIIRDWQKCYATALTLQQQRIERSDDVERAVTIATDVAASTEKVPTTTGGEPFIVTTLPIIATTRRKVNPKSYPDSYKVSRYVNGFSFVNQKVLAFLPSDTTRTKKAIAKKFSAIIKGLEAKGQDYVNVLESRDTPFFWHKGNPLVFTWVMPRQIFGRSPLEVDSVQFNVGAQSEAPENNLAKVREQRLAFEAFLAKDEEYGKALKEVKLADTFKDKKAKSIYLGIANARRAELLKIWKGDSSPANTDNLDAPVNYSAPPVSRTTPRAGIRVPRRTSQRHIDTRRK